MEVDVQEVDCDFYCFSGHKLYGPTGIGVLWGREEILEAMPPFQGGGDMITRVSFEKTTFNRLPYRFEAGTPNIAGVIGLASAIDYIEGVGLAPADEWESELLRMATERLQEMPDVTVVGTAKEKTSVDKAISSALKTKTTYRSVMAQAVALLNCMENADEWAWANSYEAPRFKALQDQLVTDLDDFA